MNTNRLLTTNLLAETVISLSQAARRLPSFRQDRPVSPATIWRWVSEGVKLPDGTRLKLEAVRIGGRWVTSIEAISRFAQRQTNEAAKLRDTPPDSSFRTPTQRSIASEHAERQLDALGI